MFKQFNGFTFYLMTKNKTITFLVPIKLHTDFKSYCSYNQTTIKKALILAMQIILKKNKHKK